MTNDCSDSEGQRAHLQSYAKLRLHLVIQFNPTAFWYVCTECWYCTVVPKPVYSDLSLKSTVAVLAFSAGQITLSAALYNRTILLSVVKLTHQELVRNHHQAALFSIDTVKDYKSGKDGLFKVDILQHRRNLSVRLPLSQRATTVLWRKKQKGNIRTVRRVCTSTLTTLL